MASNPNSSGSSSDDSNSSVFYHDDQALEPTSSSDRFPRIGLNSEEVESVPSPLKGKGYVNNNNVTGIEETVLPTHEQLMAVRHKKKVCHSVFRILKLIV